MNENKIISKDHMYKLKETDKNKIFNELNGEQFNLNFIVQDKSIIVNFLKDGTAIKNKNLEFTTGSSAEELEINLLQLDKVIDVIKTETVRFPHSITIEAENHLKPKNNLKFTFEFTKMKSTFIAIFLLQHVAGDIKPGNIIDIVGSPTKLKAYLNKDGGNKISFMLLFEFPKDDKSTKDEPTTGFVHLITQSTGKGEKGDITDNVTAVYVKKENKEISFKINFGGGKADKIIKLAVTFSQDKDSLEIERNIPKIELSKINRIFVNCWFSTRCYVTTSGYIGTEKMNRITEFNYRVNRINDN
uniref:Galectin n=1 Tax=Meloidogyne floridensis TaxID=298350 RepID=A0A915NJA2_9BILA